MSLGFAIYLIGILDGLKGIMIGACVIAGMATFLLIMAGVMALNDNEPVPFSMWVL